VKQALAPLQLLKGTAAAKLRSRRHRDRGGVAIHSWFAMDQFIATFISARPKTGAALAQPQQPITAGAALEPNER